MQIGIGKLTLKNVGNDKITVIGADDSEFVYGLSDGLNFDKADLSKAIVVTISAYYESKIFDATEYKNLVKIDASDSNALEIIGNAKNNNIVGTFGDDLITGGKGNDTLTGGEGDDVFIYSGGKEVITDYSAGDTIKLLSGKISKTTYKDNDVIFTVGSGSITVKDGNNQQISILDSKDNLQIYSNTLNLLTDNNYFSNANILDSVLNVSRSDLYLGQLEYQNTDNIISPTDSVVASEGNRDSLY